MFCPGNRLENCFQWEYANNIYLAFPVFCQFILIGAMIIMNLFIGVIMNSMQESQNELSQELQEIKFQDIKSEELYIHLINKIDELRNEIQTLNKMRKE